MKKIYTYILILAALLTLAFCGYAGWVRGSRPLRQLTILHVNDTHSHMEPLRSGEDAGMGGALERAAYVDSVRKADGPENVLLLHAGDFCQGTSYFSELGGQVEVRILNAIGYDAVALGNHEFDNGIESLEQLLSGLHMPVLCCNYDFSSFGAGKYIRPYTIIQKAGLRIGVIGVLCGLKDMVAGDIADRLPAFDTVPTVQKYADALRPRCDLVIALTHIGFGGHNPDELADKYLAAATRNIDLIVGGHSHTLLDAPVKVRNLDGQDVPIVQVGSMGTYMGEFKVKR